MKQIISYPAAGRNFTASQSKKNEFIVIHYVGAVSSAKSNALNLRNNQTSTSAQYFVDERDIYQTVKDSDIAWTVGLANPNAYKHPRARNSNTINIEMCCKQTAAGIWYIEEQTVKNTIELVAYLMEKYDISLMNVLRHYDVTGKHCPEPFVRIPSLWNKFHNDVAAIVLGEGANGVMPYRVRKAANDAASQLQAYNNLESARDLARRNPGYEVYDKSGKLIYDPTEELQQFRYYKVVPKDSWWKIAAKQMGSGLKYEELAKFNGMTTSRAIFAGQVLKIPA